MTWYYDRNGKTRVYHSLADDPNAIFRSAVLLYGIVGHAMKWGDDIGAEATRLAEQILRAAETREA